MLAWNENIQITLSGYSVTSFCVHASSVHNAYEREKGASRLYGQPARASHHLKYVVHYRPMNDTTLEKWSEGSKKKKNVKKEYRPQRNC